MTDFPSNVAVVVVVAAIAVASLPSDGGMIPASLNVHSNQIDYLYVQGLKYSLMTS